MGYLAFQENASNVAREASISERHPELQNRLRVTTQKFEDAICILEEGLPLVQVCDLHLLVSFSPLQDGRMCRLPLAL